jgi:hypothetical protein
MVMKIFAFVLLSLFLLSGVTGADDLGDGFYGPFWSRTVSLPVALYYQLAGMKAAVAAPGSVNVGLNLLDGQMFVIYPTSLGPPPTYERLFDFETLLTEVRLSWVPAAGLEAGATARLVFVYGGFLDPIIAGFHRLIGLPANGRDVIPENEVHISVSNDNGINLELDHPAFGLGDIDLWAKLELLRTPNVALSGLVAVKLPTGNPALLLGSGYFDLAVAGLFDWYISSLFAFYLNAGLVVPWNAVDPSASSRPFVMANVILGSEFAPTSWLSFLVQIEMRTAPLQNNMFIIAGTNIGYFSVPQTAITFGAAFRIGALALQVYFKEDIFGYGSEDFAVDLMAVYHF